MNKISVGATILQGYGFAARRALANVGLTWLAAVFYAVAAGYWLQQFCTTMLVSPHPGSELNDFAIFDLFCLVVVTALGSAVIARTLTGAALEPGAEIATAYLEVAKREWILFLSLLRLYAFIVVALTAIIVLGGLAIAAALPMIGANAAWHGIGVLPAMNAAIAVVAFAVTATLMVRLGFFAPSVASAEYSSSMVRAWGLSRGNSWRVFVVALGLGAPALLLWAAAEWALVGNGLSAALATALSPSHNSTAFYQLINANAPVITALWALLIVVLNIVFAGASVSAYATVRDNVTSYEPRSVQRTPLLEPSFAGSFAGFAPRDAKEPTAGRLDASDTETPPETFAAIEHDKPLTTIADAPAEVSVPEPQLVDARVAEASSIVVPIAAADLRAPLTRNEPPAAVAPDETAAAESHAEAAEVIPLPSHGDATESSQQNAPSEAA